MNSSSVPGVALFSMADAASQFFRLNRSGSLALVVALHAGLIFLALQHLPRTAMVTAPQEIVATLLTLDSRPLAAPASAAARPQTSTPTPTPKAETPKPVVKSEPALEANKAVAAPAVPAAASSSSATSAAATTSASPTPTHALPATPKTISGVQYLKPPQPEYPPLAKRAGEQGRVILRVLVNEYGLPEQAQIQQSSGSTRLDEAARQAAIRAQFKPHREDGRAVPVYAVIPINFSIQ